MARHFWTERVDAKRPSYRSWRALQGCRYGGICRNASFWNLLKRCIDALLVGCHLLLLRHGGVYDEVALVQDSRMVRVTFPRLAQATRSHVDAFKLTAQMPEPHDRMDVSYASHPNETPSIKLRAVAQQESHALTGSPLLCLLHSRSLAEHQNERRRLWIV
jgi:hypothetical protein